MVDCAVVFVGELSACTAAQAAEARVGIGVGLTSEVFAAGSVATA